MFNRKFSKGTSKRILLFLKYVSIFFSPFLPLFIPANTSSICGVAWSMWTEFLVVGGSGKGAEPALVPPAPASVAAALGSGDEVLAARSHLAHGLQNFSKAKPPAIICKEEGEGLK